MAALMEEAAGELRSLIAKATAEDLSDGGRYFAETCDDLTRCRHEEIGEYQHATDGELIEWLWNRRNEIADLYAAHSEPRPVAGDTLEAFYAESVPAVEMLPTTQVVAIGGFVHAVDRLHQALATHSPAPTEAGEVGRLREAVKTALIVAHASGPSWLADELRAALSSTKGGAEG